VRDRYWGRRRRRNCIRCCHWGSCVKGTWTLSIISYNCISNYLKEVNLKKQNWKCFYLCSPPLMVFSIPVGSYNSTPALIPVFVISEKLLTNLNNLCSVDIISLFTIACEQPNVWMFSYGTHMKVPNSVWCRKGLPRSLLN
jgi:hypothetical protein